VAQPVAASQTGADRAVCCQAADRSTYQRGTTPRKATSAIAHPPWAASARPAGGYPDQLVPLILRLCINCHFVRYYSEISHSDQRALGSEVPIFIETILLCQIVRNKQLCSPALRSESAICGRKWYQDAAAVRTKRGARTCANFSGRRVPSID